MIVILALGASACIALPLGGLVGVGLLIHRRAQLRQGARLDRSGTAYAIDSAGQAYEAVAVEDCKACGQTLPTDHQCRGAA